jgi:hypothetical protein
VQTAEESDVGVGGTRGLLSPMAAPSISGVNFDLFGSSCTHKINGLIFQEVELEMPWDCSKAKQFIEILEGLIL